MSGTADKPAAGARAEKPASPPRRERDSGAQNVPFGVQVVLKVDASHLDKNEIVDLVKQLSKVVAVDG